MEMNLNLYLPWGDALLLIACVMVVVGNLIFYWDTKYREE